jgi:hypothetical protein
MEHPKLHLGLVGFSATQRMALAAMLQAYQNQHRKSQLTTDYCLWQLVDYCEADALMLNAQHSVQGPDRVLRIHSDPDHPSPIGITVSELAVPFAVARADALPADARQYPNMQTVDIANYHSVQEVLRHFEAILSPLRSVYRFAQQLMQWRTELNTKLTYQVVRPKGTLALVDLPHNTVWLREQINPTDLAECVWNERAPVAPEDTRGFMAWTLEEAFWIFARHSKDIKLPSRYLDNPIYFRRVLRVRSSLVYPSQIELLEQLSRRPLGYEDLLAMPTVDAARLKQDLYALYMCHAITTDPRKVISEKQRAKDSAHEFSPSTHASAHTSAHASMHGGLPNEVPTVPIGLQTSPSRLV